MAYQAIILERDGAVGKLTFNRPDVLNAYNKLLSDEILHGFDALAKDEAVRVIVITGTGRAFMAGADINMVNGWSALGDLRKIDEALDKMFNPNLLEDCPKPVIAAVNGLAFGMGCEIALACDFRIAVQSAKFGQPEIKLGILPGGGGTQRLLHLIGATRTMELITTGDPITAEEAYRIGLVNRVVPDDKLWEEVQALVKRILDKGAVALDCCKRAVHQGGQLPLRKGIEYERARFCELLLTEDAREGTKAFIEKRKPQFKGK